MDDSMLEGGNLAYLDSLYEAYLIDANSVSLEWRNYFSGFTTTKEKADEPLHSKVRLEFLQHARTPHAQNANGISAESLDAVLMHERKQIGVLELINAYRLFGHLHAHLSPIAYQAKPVVPELEVLYHGLSFNDFKTEFSAGSVQGPHTRTLETLVKDLKKIYASTLACEFMHLSNSSERWWVQSKIENLCLDWPITPVAQKRIFSLLTSAEGLEKYLGSQYPGAKRFSLEGTDSLIVAIDTLIQDSGVLATKEVVIGMSHRGRLNVLINILGKSPSLLFDEFEGKVDKSLESGDVKYHQGFSSDVETPGGNVHLSLAFNPSHLEIVSPVVCGSVRARLDRQGVAPHKVLPILMHGDAAFAGQGVVMETLNMSQTRGFCIGGTVHILVNNQIGFTISEPQDARSTLYASDVAKMIQAPIFHVNSDDPEAVYLITQLALEYREKFKKDVVIDLVGYRRHGHNEADEPSATQPDLYQHIRAHPTVLTQYGKQLVDAKVLSEADVALMIQAYRSALDSRQATVARNLVKGWRPEFLVDWTPYLNHDWRMPCQTGVSLEVLKTLGKKLETQPPGFVLHPRVAKIMDDRALMSAGQKVLDWGYAENMAYASLAHENSMVRLSGQDSGRGTFFHRHAVLHDQNTGAQYIPLQHINENSKVFVIDSLLSELAVVGFEYGFAATEPRALVVWEAQFGDFANGAQIVIDQFISSGEQKWGRVCGLTLLLPHGFEGMGPEHSSARLERYLQLCAEDNIQVCVPTTPAQIFHLLRRQVVRLIRKPLIVMSPKSLLRHPLAVSSLQDLSEGQFQTVISETAELDMNKITRLIFCSGKVYYDLFESRAKLQRMNVALIRIEQLYPFPDVEIKAALVPFATVATFIWCQEEPKNQGAWLSVQPHLGLCLSETQTLQYAGRAMAASPAVGYARLHEVQQTQLINEALGV